MNGTDLPQVSLNSHLKEMATVHAVKNGREASASLYMLTLISTKK